MSKIKVAELYITTDLGGVLDQGVITLIEGRGVRGDKHCGPTMYATSREDAIFRGIARDDAIFNWRQVSITSLEEQGAISAALGVHVTGRELQSNIVLGGGVDISHLAAGTMIRFAHPNGKPCRAQLMIMGTNRPCVTAQGNVEATLTEEDKPHVRSFVKEAYDLRGCLAIVMAGGRIKPGYLAEIYTPKF